MEKFFILIIKKDYDALEFVDQHRTDRISGRSKAYASYEEAEAKAQEYISEGRAKRYFICEAVACVQVKPNLTETIKITS